MFASPYASILLFLPLPIFAQSTPIILCIAGQCLQGYSNTTIGAKLSTSPPIHLLPGVYSATTNPQLLHDALTSSSTSISSSPGFSNSSLSLPLNLELQSGLSLYSGSLYSGDATFQSLPTSALVNTSVPLTSKSLALSSNVWIAANANSNRVIIWDAVPDVAQLPQNNQGSLALLDIQSAACTPSCAASGVCTSSGTCQCASGFTGVSCESCAAGFFGPNCQSCPSNCKECDDGITGSGRCLKPDIANDPATCNCKNGVCGANGQCTCSPGFTTGDDGTACSKCSAGFFLTSSGDCQVCQLGCTQCLDGTGTCTACKSGFSQDGNDRTKCNPPVQATTTGQACPDGSFANGATCSQCSTTCSTCTGGTSNDCIVCASGLFTLNGACVGTDTNGVCQGGSNLIADNNKRECDSCGATCTACKIPNFSVASTVDQKQCTSCLPGFFLSNGACVQTCPSGTTVSSQDNLTCIACDSSCTSCSGTSTFCLTCSNNQLASNGRCVGACPSSTFSSSGACLTCHPDCTSCSGGSFNQCTACPASRPVLTNGRCLPTCSKTQFFDARSGTCQACDSSCSSCSGPGQANCLACSSSSQVLRAGSCVNANCQGTSNVVAGLGVCLSDLVLTAPSGTGTAAPLPTVTGIDSPTTIVKKGRLEWWQILLMALGCAFIFLVVVWLFRRRQKKQRAKKTGPFAAGASPTRGRTSGGWRWRLIRWGEKLFGHTKSQRVRVPIVHLGPNAALYEPEDVKLGKLRAAEEARSYSPPPPQRPNRGPNPTFIADDDAADEDMVRLIGSYNRPVSPPERTKYHPYHTRITAADHDRLADDNRSSLLSDSSRLSAPSMYSQMTGMPRRGVDPRMPSREEPPPLPSMTRQQQPGSRFSMTTAGTDNHNQPSRKNPFWK